MFFITPYDSDLVTLYWFLLMNYVLFENNLNVWNWMRMVFEFLVDIVIQYFWIGYSCLDIDIMSRLCMLKYKVS